MANANGKITHPVGIGDLQTVLGTGEKTIGRICRLNTINMWSKWKPVPKTVRDINNQLNSDKTWKTETQIEALGIQPWWKGLDGNYGLTFTYYAIGTGKDDFKEKLTTLANAIDGNMNGWEYVKPNTSTHPKSYVDFNQYNHRAPRPVSSMGGDSEVKATASSVWGYQIQYRTSDTNLKPITDRDFLVPEDIITTRPIYRGVAIFKKTNNQYEAMAWNIGDTWEGLGVLSASSTDGSTTGEQFDTAYFKNGGIYYALPVLFSPATAFSGDNELEQTTPGRSQKPTTGTPYPLWVIPIPNTTFVSFTTTQVSSTQRIGWPWLSNSHPLPPVSGTLCPWGSRLYIDSSVDPDWYLGGQVTLDVYVVNELFNGQFISGTYADVVEGRTITVPANTRYTAIEWGSNSGDRPLLNLDINHSWYVVVNMRTYTNPVRKIALMMPAINQTPSSQ